MLDSLLRNSNFENDEDKEPFELVIDKNLRSRTRRIQDSTREELSRVLSRVENTLVEYERAVTFDPKKITSGNIEYLKDINQLEEILSDKVAKFKYKQQITVFIVGQSEAIERKNIILAQLNDFFNDQISNLDPNQLETTDFGFNLQEVKDDVNECLETSKMLGARLEELNENIIQYLIQNNSPKQAKALIERSRKKLETSLKDAKTEVANLNEKIKATQTELSVRDEKIQILIKQIETKQAELNMSAKKQAIKGVENQASSAANNNDSNKSAENQNPEDELARKNSEIQLLKMKQKKMENQIKSLNRKLAKLGIEVYEIPEEVVEIVPEKPKEEKPSENVPQIDISELEVLKYKHEQDTEALKKEHDIQIEALTNKLKLADVELDKYKKALLTQQSTKGKAKKGKKGVGKGKLSKGEKDKQAEVVQEEVIEEKNQDENQQLKMIDELEAGGKIEDIDLTTEDWVNVNPLELTKRYEMLRRYAVAKINSLKNEYTKLSTSDKEKIDKLKKQYYEHRVHWETEKLVLLNVKEMEFSWDRERSKFLDKADVAYKLQEQAEETAEKAIKQLEDFITEDAKLDRENAENTITIMRERSRTFTNLSINRDNANEEKRTEKVQVLIDNLTIKFSTKSALEKIIEYINFETSNKYTVIFNQMANNSRPNTRGTNLSVASKPTSPTVRKLSGTKAFNSSINNKSSKNSLSLSRNNFNNNERKSSRLLTKADYENDDEFDYEDFEEELNDNLMASFKTNNEAIESVLTKVLSKEEQMIAGMRNTVQSRATLRSKHLAQLEENKASLNQIKSHQIKIEHDDFEFPKNDYINEQKTTTDKVKHAEAVLTRIASAKIKDATKSVDILSHPIVIEFLKMYDIVFNFKQLVEKIIPLNSNQNINQTLEKLKQLNKIDFNNKQRVTPQTVSMTLSADTILSEIKILFDQTVDELVLCKYDILDKENQLMQLKQQHKSFSRRNSTTLKLNEDNIKELESQIETQKLTIDELNKNIEELKDELCNYRKIDSEKVNLTDLNNKFDKLESDYVNQINSFKKEIKIQMAEIKHLSRMNIKLKTDLEKEKTKQQHSSASLVINNQPLFVRAHTSLSSFKHRGDLLKDDIIFPLLNSHKFNDFEFDNSVNSKTSSRHGLMIENSVSNQTGFMLTNFDIERNKKLLKSDKIKNNLSKEIVEKAIKLMDEYTKVTSKRFIELVIKYYNYFKFKSISKIDCDDNDGSPEKRDSMVSIEKIKTMREKKFETSKARMKSLNEKRINIAINLTETFENIERESGIFLIRPYFSYQGESPTDRFLKLNKLKMTTFISNKDSIKSASASNSMDKNKNKLNESINLKQTTHIITSNNDQLQEEKSDFLHTNIKDWDVSSSFVGKPARLAKANSASSINLLINTPRILELDINRMMITHNQISSKQVNGNSRTNNLRSYLAISRPTGTKLDNQTSSEITTEAILIENNKKTMILPPILPRYDSIEKEKIMTNGEPVRRKTLFENDISSDELVSIRSDSILNELSRANTDLI